MAEILDNQEITTTILNNLAIDLGATSFNGFTTNKFGADALNDITKSLVSAGITQGGNKCAPYIFNGDLYINTGTIVFATGAKYRIESPVKVENQASTYIYALNDTSRNIAQIIVSPEAPITGDFVTIASVDASGNLSDVRMWAKSNVLLASNQTLDKSVDMIVSSSSDNTVTIELNWSGWNYIILSKLKYYVEQK